MLADDVRLIQSTHPPRVGAANVGMFFGIYSRKPPARLAPAWLEGREVIAVYEDPQAVKPSYLMWLEWRDGRISWIRDTKYVRYVIDDAELILAPGAAPPDETVAGSPQATGWRRTAPRRHDTGRRAQLRGGTA